MFVVENHNVNSTEMYSESKTCVKIHQDFIFLKFNISIKAVKVALKNLARDLTKDMHRERKIFVQLQCLKNTTKKLEDHY